MTINQLNKMEQIALFMYILLEESGYDIKNKNDYEVFLKKHNIDAGKIFNYYHNNRISFLNDGILSFILKNDSGKIDNEKIENEEYKKIYIEVLIKLSELFSNLIDFSTEEQKKYFQRCKTSTELLLNELKVKRRYMVSEICENLSNPLDNDEFLKKVLGELLKNNNVDVRYIWLSQDKKANDDDIILEDYQEFYLRLIKYFIKRLILILENKKYNLLSNKLREVLSKNNSYGEVLQNLKKFTIDDYYRIFNCINEGNFSGLDSVYSPNTRLVLNGIVDDLDVKNGWNSVGSKTFYNSLGEGRAMVRIYLNPPWKIEMFLFFESYIKKCLKYGIGYCIKGKEADAPVKDRTILYLSIEQLPIVIKILNEIEYEHPEWIETFGTPPSNTGILNNSYYGVCHIGGYSYNKERKVCTNNMETYNDYCNRIFKLAFNSLIAKIAVDKNMVTDVNDREYLRKLAKLVDVKYNEDNDKIFSNAPHNCSISLRKMNEIVKKYDLLNKIKRMYPNLINNSDVLKLFKRRCQHIADGLEGRLGKKQGNVCVSKLMDDYCELEKQMLRDQKDEMIGKKRKS